MKIGQAIEQMQLGKQVARTGWNGKKMYLFYVPGSTFFVNRSPLNQMYPEGSVVTYQPHVDMRTADQTIVPWLCSQSDLLAVDWEVVDASVIELAVAA